MLKIYYKSPYVCIWYNETYKTGGAVWQGNPVSEQFREAFQKCYTLIAEKQLVNWIGDQRKMQAISASDEEWVIQLIPHIMSAGLQKMASIIAEDVYLQIAVINMFDAANSQLTFRNQFFPSPEAACEWLGLPLSEFTEISGYPAGNCQ